MTNSLIAKLVTATTICCLFFLSSNVCYAQILGVPSGEFKEIKLRVNAVEARKYIAGNIHRSVV